MLALFDKASRGGDYGRFVRVGYFSGSRYLAPFEAQYDWKRIDPPEAASVRAAGLILQLNWETSGGMMIGTPAGVGHAHGLDAADQAHKIGGYDGDLVYFSDDTNTGSLDQVAPYMEGVTAAVGPQGFYGPEPTGLQLMDRGLASGLWVANASSWSGYGNDWGAMRRSVDPRAGLIQHTDHPLGFAGEIDHNEILRTDWLGGHVSTLDPNDPIVAELRAGALRTADVEARLTDIDNIIFGAPNRPANFFTDIHSGVGATLTELRALVARPAGTVDAAAVAAELAKLLPAPDVRAQVAAVLQSAHA
jgi:hypothetical protein